MLSTGTPFAESTDTNVCRISLGTQSSPRPAFFVMIRCGNSNIRDPHGRPGEKT